MVCASKANIHHAPVWPNSEAEAEADTDMQADRPINMLCQPQLQLFQPLEPLCAPLLSLRHGPRTTYGIIQIQIQIQIQSEISNPDPFQSELSAILYHCSL